MTTKRRAAQLDREINAALARSKNAGSGSLAKSTGSGRLIIDHRRIPPEDLRIEKSNASHSPDGETFPWYPRYPLAGGTVYYNGKLWTVFDKEGDGPSMRVHLVGQGHDGEVTAPRDKLRPITWTQRDEDQLKS